MSSMTPADAAAALREAVTTLSARLGSDFSDLVPEASAERTAAVVAKLDGGVPVLGPEETVTLDSWIRLADSAVLHDDPAEAEARERIANRLRAVRECATIPTDRLTDDPRS